MHEMSIAGAVLDAVLRHAAGRRVTRVSVRVGALRQVVPSALEFAWELVRDGTVAEQAPLELQSVAAEARCRYCEETTAQARFPMRCGTCGALDVEVVRGSELEIEWIEVEAAAAGPAAAAFGEEMR